MPVWKRDICGSVFQFSDWGVDVVSEVKPDKYSELSDAEHWDEVANFECAGLSKLCQHIVDNYPSIVSDEPLGQSLPLCFGIAGSVAYNDDLTVTFDLPDIADKSDLRAWCTAEFGAGKVLIND